MQDDFFVASGSTSIANNGRIVPYDELLERAFHAGDIAAMNAVCGGTKVIDQTRSWGVVNITLYYPARRFTEELEFHGDAATIPKSTDHESLEDWYSAVKRWAEPN